MNVEHEGGSDVVRRHRHWHGGALRFHAIYFLLPLAILLSTGTTQAGQRTPYLPASANVVLQRVPPTTDPRVRRFDQLRADLQQHPHDVQKAVTLAHAYIDYGRATGDARFLGRAMAVIEPWMTEPVPPIPVLLVHATIQQSRHFFQASREELTRDLVQAKIAHLLQEVFARTA